MDSDDDKGKAPPGVTPGIYLPPVRWEADEHASRALMRQAEASENIARAQAEAERHKAASNHSTYAVPAIEERKRDTWKTMTIGLVVLAIVAIGTRSLPVTDLLKFYLSCTGILAAAWGATEIFKKKPPSLPPPGDRNAIAK